MTGYLAMTRNGIFIVKDNFIQRVYFDKLPKIIKEYSSIKIFITDEIGRSIFDSEKQTLNSYNIKYEVISKFSCQSILEKLLPNLITFNNMYGKYPFTFTFGSEPNVTESKSKGITDIHISDIPLGFTTSSTQIKDYLYSLTALTNSILLGLAIFENNGHFFSEDLQVISKDRNEVLNYLKLTNL